MVFPLYSLGGAVAKYLPAGVVKALGNRIVVVGVELAADRTLEHSAGS